MCCRSPKPELLRTLLATLDSEATLAAAALQGASTKPLLNGHTNGFVNGWIGEAAPPRLSKHQQARRLLSVYFKSFLKRPWEGSCRHEHAGMLALF